jgi:hypothetical protein
LALPNLREINALDDSAVNVVQYESSYGCRPAVPFATWASVRWSGRSRLHGLIGRRGRLRHGRRGLLNWRSDALRGRLINSGVAAGGDAEQCDRGSGGKDEFSHDLLSFAVVPPAAGSLE